jgi:hypothetical protein
LPAPLLPRLDELPRMTEPGDQPVEDGFGRHADGTVHVAVRTAFPGAAPAMIDWWFAWHSDEPERYKLWHPRAHVHAAWKEPGQGYVGRTSLVDEYLGDKLGRYAIRFVAPRELGLAIDPARETAVCARVGFVEVPLDAGWLVHHVRRTPDGCEMRSRFWLGGAHVSARRGGRIADSALRAIARRASPGAPEATALLVHCAQEMTHLASFLPALYGFATS